MPPDGNASSTEPSVDLKTVLYVIELDSNLVDNMPPDGITSSANVIHEGMP